MDFSAQPSHYWCRCQLFIFGKIEVLFFLQLVSGMSILSTASVRKTYKKYFHYGWALYAVLKQNFVKWSEKFPRIPLPHLYIMVIYFEFKNFDPFCMSQVGAFFVKFVPKSFEFQLCVFKAFINAGTSQFFCILQAWQQNKQTNKRTIESFVLWRPDLFFLLPALPEKQLKWEGCIS